MNNYEVCNKDTKQMIKNNKKKVKSDLGNQL